MPPRLSHLPHNLERTALQKLSATRGLLLAQLHPAGKQTVAGMEAKAGSRSSQTLVGARDIASRRPAKRR